MTSPAKFCFSCILIASILITSQKSAYSQLRKISVDLKAETAAGKKLPSFNKQIQIVYYLKYALIEVPVISMTKEFQASDGSNSFKETASRDSTGTAYYVYRIGSAQGLAYDSLSQKKGKVFSVDSLLQKEAFAGANFHNSNTDSLISSIALSDQYASGTETYLRNSDLVKDSKDTLILYYTHHLHGIPYSLSPTIDSPQKGKVFKIEYMYLAGKRDPEKSWLQKMKAVFEIKESKVLDKDLLKYFKKFIEQYK